MITDALVLVIETPWSRSPSLHTLEMFFECCGGLGGALYSNDSGTFNQFRLFMQEIYFTYTYSPCQGLLAINSIGIYGFKKHYQSPTPLQILMVTGPVSCLYPFILFHCMFAFCNFDLHSIWSPSISTSFF